MPNKPPHPPYSDKYVLPKTKYGIPVTPEMFEDNSFANSEEDHKSRWWEKVWAEDEAKQRRLREQREERGEADEVERNQRYRATTAEELKAYRIWQQENEAIEREQARDRRFRQAAKEAEEIMEGPREKMVARQTVDRKEITPWEFVDEDEGGDLEIGSEGQKTKLRKWFKKILP